VCASTQQLRAMPPRRSARVAAVAERQSSALAPLPYALVLHIFSLLPVDQRMRCAEVCRGWRVVLSDASLWLRLDLSTAGGVARKAATNALLRAAAARAAGGLRALDAADCGRIPHDVVCAVAAEHAGALAELRVGHSAAIFHHGALRPAGLEQLLRAAPQLRLFEADASCEGVGEARRLLRNEAPFGLLRLRNLSAVGLDDTDAVRSFIEHAAAH
jgi:hypothetical protein